MELRAIPRNSDYQDTPWTKNRSHIVDRAVQAVSKSNKTRTNKTLLCLAGGVGRTANALGDLGFDRVFSSDIRQSHLNVGKTYYKNIGHVLQDYTTPVAGYDYFLNENIFDQTYREDTYKIIADWNRVSEHLLDSYTYFIYRFNCRRLDQRTPWQNLYKRKVQFRGIDVAYRHLTGRRPCRGTMRLVFENIRNTHTKGDHTLVSMHWTNKCMVRWRSNWVRGQHNQQWIEPLL
jgi:hypothetical protein